GPLPEAAASSHGNQMNPAGAPEASGPGGSFRGRRNMLSVGDKFPEFNLKAVVSRDPEAAFATISDQAKPDTWRVYFFWPKDFTFVCPTEIAAFGRLHGEFADRNAEVIGVSTDSEYVHLAWRNTHADLADLPFP